MKLFMDMKFDDVIFFLNKNEKKIYIYYLINLIFYLLIKL